MILLANRDEFYNRPAEKAGFWENKKNILAGKDVKAGGTWLGINKYGKFAAITNYRDLKNIKPNAPSRGKITLDFLENDFNTRAYLTSLNNQAQDYNGFNLLLGESNELFYYSNVSGDNVSLPSGLYGLSNHLLDTPWPKVVKAKNLLNNFDELNDSQMLQAFSDTELAADHELPDTGVGMDLERKLSAMFIHFDNYGTRCTTLLTIDYRGQVHFRERTFFQGKINGEDTIYNFTII